MRERGNSSEQRGLDFSMQVYRRLLRAYPNAFRDQFGDQLMQSFGDLARRALHVGGRMRLMMLWMRVLPDLAVSAVREHSSSGRGPGFAHVRLRWVLACMFGLEIGWLVSDKLTRLGMPNNPYLFMGIGLGLLQSAWALKRPAGEVLRWTAATTLGMLLAALPVIVQRFRVQDVQPDLRSFSGIAIAVFISVLVGAGIGLFQSFVLSRGTAYTWRWTVATAVGMTGGNWGTMAFLNVLFSFGFDLTSLHLMVVGGILGCVTCIPLGSIVRPMADSGVGDAVQS